MTIEELKVIIRAETTQLRNAVKDVKSQTAGMTKEVSEATKEINQMSKDTKSSTDSMGAAFKKLGTIIASVFSIRAIYNFVKECVSAASEMESAYTGLKSIMDGQGKSFQSAQGFIQSYTKDGLVPATNAINAYKNLALRGYDDSQIQAVMSRLKDSAAFGRQASYTLGEAIETASEGLKNENSILVDNAGVTKNVAKMWEDYAKSIGVSSTSLTQAQKIQAEVNGILEETKYQVGDSSKILDTYQGKLLGFQATLYNLKVAIGQAFMPILSVVLPILSAVVNAIKTVVVWANALFSVLFGKSSGGIVSNKDASNSASLSNNLASASNSADSLGSGTSNVGSNLDKANKKAKDLKKNLMGFDEIHNLSGNTTTDSALGGSGGSGGGSVGSIDTSGLDEWSGIMAGLDSQIDSVKSKLEKIAPILRAIAAVVGVLSVSALISFLMKGGSWKGLKELISSLTMVSSQTGKVRKLGTAANIIKAAFKSMNPYVLAAVTVVTALALIIRKVWTTSESLRKTCVKVWKQIQSAIVAAKKKIWKQGLKPLLDELDVTADTFSELWTDYISPIFSWILEHIVKTLGDVVVKAIWFSSEMITVFAKISTGIVRVFKGIGTKVKNAINAVMNIKDAIKEKWNEAKDWWDNKKVELSEIKTKITYTAVKEKIFDELKAVYESVRDSKAVKTISGAKAAAFDAVKEKWNALKSHSIVKTAKSKLTDGFKSLYNKWTALKDKAISIKASVSGAITNLKKLINDKIIKPINSNIISTLRKIPGLGNLKKIPLLARGGVVDTKTLFYAGESGQEVVMPLENNTGWITKLAGMITSMMPQQSNASDKPIELTLQIGSTKFGKIVINSINALQAREGKILINL